MDLENITSTVALELDDCLLDEGLVARDGHLQDLTLEGCQLEHPSLPPLDAARLTTTLLMVNRATIKGHNSEGAMIVACARLDRLDCTGAILRNDSGPALSAYGVRVEQYVALHDGFEAIGAGSSVAVDLTNARVGGELRFEPALLAHATDPQARLDADGLSYSGLPLGVSTSAWLRLLREGTPAYAAQPYQHLASAHRAAGHDSEARRILMAQRRDQIGRRALAGRAERTWARFTGFALGYGYQPWRTLIGLLAVAVTAVVLAVVLGGHGGLIQPRTPPTPCTVVERIGIGLDLGTPLITTGARTRCEATNTATGQILTATGWGLRCLAWAFATLFVAGFTSAVRRT